ncbi:metallo-mystery pair system four-Cys motif protein [Alteromonas pelagimontana]|uniref:Metallo-mystery pair system four-Cys motif protein n=1 Tax=Alteromonas pelagimontana TaxID=1858656 RepID=A0A6M4MHR1_9ALTE|nr:MbnP family protein [Alteromonas pelagimontana]QJR81706.1 metallo-mystery pair system four-Cys motif protein [Alteromonas pelagimontana]
MSSKSSGPGDIPIRFVDLQKGEDCSYLVDINHELWKVNYLSFYLTEPELKVEGRWVPLNFDENEWQSKKASLLQFHNACDASANNTHIKLNTNVKLLARATSLRFSMGLPFKENHAPVAEQVAPLNNAAMFQSPRVGHSFMRLELQDAKNSTSIWSFMLASGNCQSEDSKTPPTVCQYPNRVTVELPMAQNVSNLRLNARLTQLLFRADLRAQAECNMANPGSASCEKVMRNLTSREWLRWDAPDKVYLR